MPPKKRPGDRWFKLAPDDIWQEYETPKDDSYVPKADEVIAWSLVVVKGAQYKILLAVKAGTDAQHAWVSVPGWEVGSVHALGGHVDVILESPSQQTAHVFMQEIAEPFDPVYLIGNCAEPDVVKPATIFIDGVVSGPKIATRFIKLKQSISALNKAKSQQTVRRKATVEEGAGSSRPLSVRRPRPVPAGSRRATPTETPADSGTPTPSQSRQTTPSKRPRESDSAMTDEPLSPELQMPKPGEGVEPNELQRITDTFETKCLHCFFMGRDFKFEVNISQCHLAPPEKCVRAKEDMYVEWVIQRMVGDQFKKDKQTLVLMPQGYKTMPTPDMWPTIAKGDFWLIDGQHSVEAAKQLQVRTDIVDKNNIKESLKVWNALVVWSDDDTRLSDISRYFNKNNKQRAYQASWIRNIMASREVWEFYGRPPRERENAKDKNPKWEVRNACHS